MEKRRVKYTSFLFGKDLIIGRFESVYISALERNKLSVEVLN